MPVRPEFCEKIHCPYFDIECALFEKSLKSETEVSIKRRRLILLTESQKNPALVRKRCLNTIAYPSLYDDDF